MEETPALSLSGEQGETFERRLRSYERLSKIVLNLIAQSLALFRKNELFKLKKLLDHCIGESLPTSLFTFLLISIRLT